MGSSASDFSFGASGVYQQVFLDQSLRKGVDEVEVAQVIEHWTTPLSKRGREVAASLLELRFRGGSNTGVLFGCESREVVVAVENREPVPWRCAGQEVASFNAGAGQKTTQI